MKFLTKENITLLLAILGSLGSVVSWLYIYLMNRKSVSVVLFQFRCNTKQMYCYMSFENHSRLPISITRIQIKVNNSYYDCKMIPIVVKEGKCEQGDKIHYRTQYHSEKMPINLNALSSHSGYVYFRFHPPCDIAPSIPLTFLLSTNRGKLKEVVLEPLQ